MEKITPNSPQAQSQDLIAKNIEQLKVLFPELISESATGAAINLDVLKALIGDNTVTDTEEKYGLNWHGKRQARQLALTPSTGTLRPCRDESLDWDNTENLMIEGDNLEVLKLLQKSYAGKVKMIYIDPPYNTGKDFVYPDNFHDNIKNYLELTGQTQEGAKLSTNTETSGRFHTDWLNMMCPRLKLARNLLRDDGVIFISIDDNEQSNLKALCDEVFGEENFVAQIVWRKKYGIQNDAKYYSVSHEYLLCIAKNKIAFKPRLLDRTEDQNNRYKNPDNDSRGAWKPGDMSVGRVTEKDTYEIVTPSGRRVKPPEGRSWVVSFERFQELVADNRIWFGELGNNVPSVKKFLTEVKQGIVPTTFWDYNEVGHTDGSNKALKALFDNKAYFDYPKPVELVKKALVIGSSDNELIFDFFSGSGTTAHAVMELNAQDGGTRKCISVQLPEPTDEKSEAFKAGYKTISEITKERIRRAGEKIKSENPQFTGDTGFRVFKLDSSNIKPWQTTGQDLVDDILASQDSLVEGRSEDDILYELLLKLGLDLCVPIAQKQIVDCTVFAVGEGKLFACLSESITRDNASTLAQGIIAWHQELDPIGDTSCVFRDSGFVDDVAKTNLCAMLAQHGIKHVRSI